MIGIIGAMEVEVQDICWQIEGAQTREIGGRTFVSGKLRGRDVVCVQCGIGKVSAALCAQSMILTYQPEIIVNTGVGGSLSPELTFGDVAIASSLVQHDFDTSPLGEPGLIPIVNKIYFECDERAVSLLMEIVNSMEGVTARTGIIASGDQFISNGARKDWIVKQYSAIACEMEGGAIAQACFVNGVKCAVLRAISDNADDESGADYGQFLKMAAARSIETLLRFVERY